jgi:hypothetical protein
VKSALTVASGFQPAPSVYENNPGGITKYYDLYDGNIPLEAVKYVAIVHITNN